MIKHLTTQGLINSITIPASSEYLLCGLFRNPIFRLRTSLSSTRSKRRRAAIPPTTPPAIAPEEEPDDVEAAPSTGTQVGSVAPHCRSLRHTKRAAPRSSYPSLHVKLTKMPSFVWKPSSYCILPGKCFGKGH